MSDVVVLIPAGGSGTRFGGAVKKQFLSLLQKPVLEMTLERFLILPEITRVIVALPLEEIEQQRKGFSHDKLEYVAGGECRAESVQNAFVALGEMQAHDIVLVHDAVRPLVSSALIQRVIQGVHDRATAVPVIPLSDTIKMVEEGVVRRTVNREHLFAAQTPQGARFELFEHAYRFGPKDLSVVTDEAMLMESIGCPVNVVAGERENIKITTPFDFLVAEAILRETQR